MTGQELLAKFRELGALKTGHFQLTSGLHSGQYMQCAAIFEYPKAASEIIKLLIPKLPQDIDTVIAPAIGGINLGYEVARALQCRFVFTEREQGKMALRRGFTLTAGEKVLVVEDVVTTGGSVREVIEIARCHGCLVQVVACLVDRSQGKVDFPAPFIPLMRMEIETFQPDQCPLCAANLPITKPGSRTVK
ncbi:MAG: orotate phosphoribosyltransferase [Firmicutes bacterium]|jgi:orotate phosphoribosyltransferase|nr:orotate phosphoribosyltransferase [Bacillota bacterium]NLL88450.1 orotate phosphoribosyltransferase [Bacillota bacterium]HKM18383.1 orotate phosphoribosyltransferase [Limnochordia bacterium]